MAESHSTPITKISLVQSAYARGDMREALRIAAKFPQLGHHKERITRAWAAIVNPAFYRAIGHDPQVLIQAGIDALVERYKL